MSLRHCASRRMFSPDSSLTNFLAPPPARVTEAHPGDGSRNWWTASSGRVVEPVSATNGNGVGARVFLSLSHSLLDTTSSAVYTTRRAPTSELPRRRCRPNQGARIPGCMVLSHRETTESTTHMTYMS